MGKHFVTVCVFCLLCATHTPCSSHVQLSSNVNDQNVPGISEESMNNLPVKNEVFQKITDRYSPTIFEEKLSISLQQHPDKDEKYFTNANSLSANLTMRTKRDIRNRHNYNNHNNINKINETEYIEKIFTMFGNGETINQDGFERLIKTLHLDELLWSKINNTSVNLSPVKVNANGIQNDTNSTVSIFFSFQFIIIILYEKSVFFLNKTCLLLSQWVALLF